MKIVTKMQTNPSYKMIITYFRKPDVNDRIYKKHACMGTVAATQFALINVSARFN